MNEELARKLTQQYPKIFTHNQNTAFSYWGFEVGDGWYEIIQAVCRLAQFYIDHSHETAVRNREFNKISASVRQGDFSEFFSRYGNMPEWRQEEILENMKEGDLKPEDPVEQMVVTQVKEKFGTLRFYYRGGDEYIRGLVDMAEHMSAVTCEQCGAPAIIDDKQPYFRAVCKEHV